MNLKYKAKGERDVGNPKMWLEQLQQFGAGTAQES
jgi:hypothetical protein